MPMYPSPHREPPGLSRYGSAPGSLLASIAESVVTGGGGDLPTVAGSGGGTMSRFYVAADDSPSLEAAVPPGPEPSRSVYGSGGAATGGPSLQSAYGPREISAAAAGGGAAPLLRHSSSPAGFFSHLMMDQGFSGGAYSLTNTRLKPQGSFSRQDSLSRISEISIPDIGDSITTGNNFDKGAGNVGHSYTSSNLPVNTWDDSMMFSAPLTKQTKDNAGDFMTNLSNLESQTSLEMASIENFFQIQQDSAPCKVRAKRGCATHPRSIAERERRTRISKKLRKLQDLVPNMDKQTNTSDMLDLAVHYIKELQIQVEKLNQEQANCTCASKQEI